MQALEVFKKVIFTIGPVLIFTGVAFGTLAFAAEQTGLMTADEFTEVFTNQVNQDEEVEFSVEDDRELEVSFDDSTREILENQTAVTIRTNKPVTLENNDRLTLFDIKEENSTHFYVLEINNIGIGQSTIRFTLNDRAYNNAPEDFEVPASATQEFSLPVNRASFALPFGLEYIEDWPGSQYVVGSSDDLLVQVSREHKLVDDYDPRDMVNISSDLFLYANTAEIEVRADAGESLRTMVLDLQNQTGKTLTIMSGYRSHNTQVQTYAGNVASFGQEAADGFSARPGFSEHHLGTVIDFYSPDTGNDLFSREFDTTVAGQWLLENAYKYGWVQTYPEGSEEITGYEYEPWQYRYIGIENAAELKDSGLVFSSWVDR